MRLSFLLLLLSISLLISCFAHHIPGNTGSKCDLTRTPWEEQPSVFNDQYLHLLDIVERISILIEEEKNQIQSIQDKIPSDLTPQQREQILGAIEKTYNNQLKMVNELHTKTSELLNAKIILDDYLFFLLKLRFEYLFGREQAIEETLSPGSSGLVNMLPTSKPFFDYLTIDSRFMRYQAMNELARTYAVSRFELLNLLIKESMSICNKEELSLETISLLRSSIQLHPILEGKREDLGHPDEACEPYAILEAMILGPDNDEHIKSLQKHFDIPAIIKLAAKGSPEDWHTITAKVIFQLMDEKGTLTKKMSRKEIGHLNELKRKIDLAVYKAHFLTKEEFIQFKNIGTPPGHGVRTNVTDYELGKWPYDLPYPSCFTKNYHSSPTQLSPVCDLDIQIEPHQEEDVTTQVYQKLANTQLGLEEKPEKEIKDTNNSPSKIKIGKQEEDMVTTKTADDSWTIPSYGLNSPTQAMQKECSTPTEGMEIIKEGKQEIRSISNVNSNSTAYDDDLHPTGQPIAVFDFTRDWVLPNGLRSFHSQMLRMVHPTRTLTTSYQSIVDNLFDNQQQGHVTYAEFQSLWKHIGGRIICGNGGSHRQLIGPQQEKLFGIFAHNNNQVYGPKYIKYLQTAVLYVGLRPTQSLSKTSK